MYNIWQQMKVYKNLLIVFWAINIFAVITAAVIAFYYFSQPQGNLLKLTQEKQNINHSLKLLTNLDAKADKTELFELNKNISTYEWAPTYKLPMSNKEILSKRIELQNRLINSLQDLENESIEFYKAQSKSQQQLIIIGVLTLIFGLFLPMAIIALMAKLGLLAKNKTEDHVKEWILQWQKENARHSDPYKSPEFWSRILVISIEHFAPVVDHPAAKYLGEISGEIKKEMLKASELQAEETLKKTDNKAA